MTDVRTITTHCDECKIKGLTADMIAGCQRIKCPVKQPPEQHWYGRLIDGEMPPIPERGATWTHPTTGQIYVAVIGDQEGAQFWVSKYMGPTEYKPLDMWPPLPEKLIDEPLSATIHTLYKTNFRDPVAALRSIADAIERGDYGEVGCMAVAVMGDKVETFGSGPDSDGCAVAMLFHAAFLRMSKSIEEHGK